MSHRRIRRADVRAASRRAQAMPPDPGDLNRPPRPVPGCPACLALAERRDAARAAYGRSAQTDADVLLRRHQRQDHWARKRRGAGRRGRRRRLPHAFCVAVLTSAAGCRATLPV